MRKLLSLPVIALSVFVAFSGAVPAIAAITLPRPAPEFVIQQTNGQQILLSGFRGKPVVLVLMYATCAHCQYTAGQLTQMQHEFSAKGVQILGATFNEGDSALIDEFKKRFNITFPCGYSNIPSVLTFLKQPQDQPYYVPILVFIDKKGMIRQQIIGDEKFFTEKEQANNIRAEVDKLVKAPAAGNANGAKAKKASKSE